MSKDWVEDIHNMHDHYEMSQKFEEMDQKTRMQFLLFREKFLREEMAELTKAIGNAGGEALKGNSQVDQRSKEEPRRRPDTPIDKAEVVDALIDLCVVAIGTLDAFGVDAHEAWDQVLTANMNKKPGVKESRPNPFDLPDLIKPDGWTAPDHSDNTGRL